MCWFSAHERISTRRAVEGEELEVRELSDSCRIWVTSPRDPEKAVCLSDGCRLRLNDIPIQLREALHVEAEAVAEFHEVYHPPRPFFQRMLGPQYLHDVLVFPNGRNIHLSLLPPGMRIDVLSKAIALHDRKWETDQVFALQP